jgi:Tol biopolymer transport system component
MTSGRRFDHDLPDLLTQVAQGPAPDYRDHIVRQTAHMRQRPAWTFPERWLPMSAVTSRAAAAPRFPLRIVGVAALLLIALIIGAVLLAGSQRHQPAPFGLAAAGRVAYAANGDIYTADPVTGAATAIVTGPDTDVQPIWSRDGTRVVFEREVASPGGAGRLYVARADGAGLVAITPNITLKQESDPSRYAFSPDGTDVVYTTGPDTAPGELWIAKTDGSGARQIDVGMSVLEIAYRPPNGTEIIFAAANSVGIGIYAVDIATNKVRTVVAPSAGIPLGLVSVAPDGSRVVYSASMDSVVGQNSYRVQVSAIDGSKTVTLPMPDGATFQDAPAWSNDGTRIVLTRGYSTRNQEMTLAVLPADGSTVGMETTRGLTGCCDTVLDWAPDDKSILVSPEDLSGNFVPQLLLDPATGLTRATPWVAISDPAWQRIAP